MTDNAISTASIDEKNGLTWMVWAALIACLALPIIFLILPSYMPVGPMYWDSYLYLDAGQRIATGQIPNVDFFAPVGPLDYYLFYWARLILPDSQPMLAASWCVALVTVPLMALIVSDALPRAQTAMAAVVVGFVLFTLIPFNTTPYYPFPGADGFGIYNRHGAQLLYVLATALLFMRSTILQAVVIALVMAALFAIKITAFAAGGLLCLWALLSGSVKPFTAIAAAAIALVIAAIIELTTGIISAYLCDIIALLGLNEGVLASRLLQGTSRTFGTFLFTGLLSLVLLFVAPFGDTLRSKIGHPALWLGIAFIAAVFYESQNTGSQEMIMLWPVVIYALSKSIHPHTSPLAFCTLGILAAAAILPPAVNTIQASARALVGMVKQQPLQHETLKSMGAVMVRPVIQERVDDMRNHWLAYPDAMKDLALEKRQLPSFLLFSDMDYQVGWMQAADKAVAALKKREADGLQFETVMNLDFTNPFAWLLDKQAPRSITIGADPFRTVPEPDEKTLEAVRETDIVLKARCPFTDNIDRLQQIYAKALTAHKEVELTPCYTALIHPRLQADWQ